MAAGEGARLVCLQELTLSPYFAITPDGPGAAGAAPEPLPGGPTYEFAAGLAAETGVPVHASLYEQADDADALGFNTAICVAPDGTLLARTRKTHLPVTAGYYEDRYFQVGDSGYPVVEVADARFGFPTCWDEWFPEVARAYALARRRGDRVPDRDRLRARPSRLRHRAALGAGDPRARHQQRHVHGGAEPHRDRRADHVLRLVVRQRPVRARARAGAARRRRPCSSPTWISISAGTGSRCSRSSPPAGPKRTDR